MCRAKESAAGRRIQSCPFYHESGCAIKTLGPQESGVLFALIEQQRRAAGRLFHDADGDARRNRRADGAGGAAGGFRRRFGVAGKSGAARS